MTVGETDALTIELQRARALCDLGRFTEAAGLLTRAVASDPQSLEARCLLSLAHLGTAQNEER